MQPDNPGLLILFVCATVPFLTGAVLSNIFTRRYLSQGIWGLLPKFVKRVYERNKYK